MDAEKKPDKKADAVKTAEQWAIERGHAPEFRPGKPPAAFPKAIVAPVHNPDYAKFRGAFFLHGWVQGQEMTGAQYDAAVEAAANHVYR